MCGIYGTTIPYSIEQVKQKLQRTDFRGPDMTQCAYMDRDQSVIFGHNRLAIIDLDPRSNQPFVYKHVSIVYNGEVYNFKTLKHQLISEGFEFTTESDTEVICALYIKHGEACVKYLNGMFAFAIYDSQKKLFFGARDRLGQKPFYIYRNGKDFEFASQISSIQLHHKQLSISSKAINYYLSWGNVP
ncbi:MAG: asparagine synthetase B, partial [Bacteroidota bacterium]